MSVTGVRLVVLCLGLLALPALAADKSVAPYLAAVEPKPTPPHFAAIVGKPLSLLAAAIGQKPKDPNRDPHRAAHQPPHAAAATEKPKAAPQVAAAAETPPAQLSEAELAAKGLQLFNDASLSGGSKASCATCHFSTGHTNNKTYVGLDVVADGDPNGRNTPTLWGVGERSVFGWAGQAATLEDSIRGIIVNRMKGPEPSKETLDRKSVV